MRLHVCRFRGSVDSRVPPESTAVGVGAADAFMEEYPIASLFTGAGAFLAVVAGSVLAPCWLSSPVLPRRMARRAAKCFSTSIFLMRLTAAPVFLLVACTVLVWSEAWRAEGEKRNFCLLSQAYASNDVSAGSSAEHERVTFDLEPESRSIELSPALRLDNSPGFCYAATPEAHLRAPGSRDKRYKCNDISLLTCSYVTASFGLRRSLWRGRGTSLIALSSSFLSLDWPECRSHRPKQPTQLCGFADGPRRYHSR